VINIQRLAIYKRRDSIILTENNDELKDQFVQNCKIEIDKNMTEIVQKQIQDAQKLNQTTNEFLNLMNKEFSLNLSSADFEKFQTISFDELKTEFSKYVTEQLKNKLNLPDKEKLYQVFKDVYLYHIDTLRVKHIDEMEYLRDKV
jgi:preprotein translocase subunit SecA